MSTTEDQHTLVVATVSSNPSFRITVARALAGLASKTRTVRGNDVRVGVPPTAWPDVCTTLSSRARIFLDDALPQATIEVVATARLGQLNERLHEHLVIQSSRPTGSQPWTAGATVLFLVDATTAVPGPDADSRLDATINTLQAAQRAFGFGLSAYSAIVYDDVDHERVYSRTLCTARKIPDEEWVLGAETVQVFTDLVQARYTNARAILPETEPPAALATELTRFLADQAGATWGLHFFTGSIIAKLIQDATLIARRQGNPVLRGPNEHSLACGALARWQLHDAPFLLIATSGMANELKGTLANLRDSQSKGFIVFGENEPGWWQPFQGTMHDHEDSRSVFEAYGLQCYYLTDPDRLVDDLTEVFRAYHRRRGPVVLLAAPSVLRHTGNARVPPIETTATRPQVGEDMIDAVANLLNRGPNSILWQCGKLDDIERNLVYDLADRAGIALVDSLGRPGTVTRYRDGRQIAEYLGTMSLYGCSPEVWRFLHPSGRLLPRSEYALFFLKSRIPDLATPVAEKVLHEAARVVQVTDTASHLAPFTDLPVVEELQSFLERLTPRVHPDDGIVRARRDAIARAHQATRDPLAQVPSVPMSHQYFFAKLNEVLTSLIVDHGYDYTGFYDVGRGGVSAIRNLPRTRAGFSGWYGRALMGDAFLAIPSVALSNPGNILGFIGDGAANLVPSIIPTLAQQLRYEAGRVEGNVSILDRKSVV